MKKIVSFVLAAVALVFTALAATKLSKPPAMDKTTREWCL